MDIDIIQYERAASALFSFISSVKIGTSEKWVLPVNVCPVVPLTLYKAGVEPVGLDVSSENLLLNLNNLRKYQLKSTISGVILIEPYGAAINEDYVQLVRDLCPKAYIIVDRCLNYPDFSKSMLKNVDAEIYSLGDKKIVNLGKGGFIKLRKSLSKGLSLISDNNGSESFLLDKIEAEIYSPSFSYQDGDWLSSIRQNVDEIDLFRKVTLHINKTSLRREHMKSILSSKLSKLPVLRDEFQNWRFNILVPNKASIIDEIFSNNLFVSSHYRPINIISDEHNRKNASLLHEVILNIFIDEYMDFDQAEAIADIIQRNSLQQRASFKSIFRNYKMILN